MRWSSGCRAPSLDSLPTRRWVLIATESRIEDSHSSHIVALQRSGQVGVGP